MGVGSYFLFVAVFHARGVPPPLGEGVFFLLVYSFGVGCFGLLS